MFIPAILVAPTMAAFALISLGYNTSEELCSYPEANPPMLLTYRKTEYLYGEPTHELVIQERSNLHVEPLSLTAFQQWTLRMQCRLLGHSSKVQYAEGCSINHRCFLDEQRVTELLYPALKAQYARNQQSWHVRDNGSNELFLKKNFDVRSL